ncbi:MAG: AMP phosphorylase, partial [Bdellovibrio sp.]
MELKVKNLEIAAGDALVAMLNYEDAHHLTIFQGDRILIRAGKNNAVAVVDITHSNSLVPRGTIGLFEELTQNLNTKSGKKVFISIAEKPKSIDYIKKKMHGEKLNEKEMFSIISDIVNMRLTEIEITYFVAACYMNELSSREIVDLTEAMINTGETLALNKYPIMDKHCIGGVAGNRTTMIIVPIVAEAGLIMPKTSSRAITSPAGTADTVEFLANVSFSMKGMKRIIEKNNSCFVWGGGINLAPSDDKLIHVERPMSLDPVGQLLASILAKKKSVSATHLLVDIPLGKGAKVESKDKALMLKKMFERISRLLKIKTKVIITDGSHPIGRGVGPALEARDVLYILTNNPKGSYELREKSLEMAGILLEMGGKAKSGCGKIIAEEILTSGRAYKRFSNIIRSQGGKVCDPDSIRMAKHHCNIISNLRGRVSHIDNKIISKIARMAGAPFDKRAGIYLHKNLGEEVHRGSLLYTIYSESKQKLMYARKIADEEKAFEIK